MSAYWDRCYRATTTRSMYMSRFLSYLRLLTIILWIVKYLTSPTKCSNIVIVKEIDIRYGCEERAATLNGNINIRCVITETDVY